MKLIFLCLLLLSTISRADPWVDDWLDQMTTTNPGYFEGQRRGYFNGGGFQARWRMSDDHLISVQPPSIRAGCGGIDMFLGGMSFLDPELLVQKFQRILQAAPAVAFDMALKTMCKECSDTMTKMERAASWVNGLQMNECAMSKRLVTTVQSDDPDVLGAMWDEVSGGVSLGSALEKNWSTHQDRVRAGNGQAPNPLDVAVQDCPADFREIFIDGSTTGGASIIQNATRKVGLSAYEDIMRGYIGDVIVTYDSNMYHVREIDKCRANQNTKFEDFLIGRAEQRPVTGAACTDNSALSLYDWIAQRLQTIATKIQTNPQAGYTADEQRFIDTSPLPVLQILTTAVNNGNINATIAVFRDPLASAYAYRVMDDLLSTMDYVLRKADRAKNTGPIAGGNPDHCQIRILEQPIRLVSELKEELIDMRHMARDEYYHRLDELGHYLRIARSESSEKSDMKKNAFDLLTSP